jgi:hypothetical protein
MNKEFVPYEEAIELKELGYDIDSVSGYSYPDSDKLLTQAILYQQAFRWFREKYGLYSAVNVDQTMEPKFAYCISKYWTDALSWGWDTIVFNSDLYYDYEEAQLTCLKKLIETAKQ